MLYSTLADAASSHSVRGSHRFLPWSRGEFNATFSLSSPLPLPSPPLLPATTCLFPFLVWAPVWADEEMMLGGLAPPDVIRLRFSQAADDRARFHSREEAGQLSDLLGDSVLQLSRATQRVNSGWYPVALDGCSVFFLFSFLAV
ncbi:hypothetical protein RHGRI_012954 [Rhododendron griersonianum]|uniref:SH3 domain-containing protein n=1 Tax=Rhododendron griersonianum TaxID=479676 RepID=A0AAV6K434_9ERIC|nr:hypothetical protein RHGRI_012954 [Rhododendron griersonianum]